jgi:hypothetical protein
MREVVDGEVVLRAIRQGLVGWARVREQSKKMRPAGGGPRTPADIGELLTLENAGRTERNVVTDAPTGDILLGGDVSQVSGRRPAP